MHYIKILALASMLLGGCQSGSSDDKKSPESDACASETSVNYVESLDTNANALSLENFGRTRLEIAPSYEKTRPSNLEWRIAGGKIIVDSTEYLLSYSETASIWNILNDNGAIVGNLAPFRTAQCSAVTQLKLTMFIPAEDASAHLIFGTL